jgi:hypothetical protein
MNMVGFDKGKDGNSISFLFLSQPIIKEYVEKMKNVSSNMADFVPDKEQKVFDELIAKYDPDTQVTDSDQYWKTMSDVMTNHNFIQNIKEKPDGKLQGAVLRRFMDMKKYGIAIRNIQTSINTDSKGLGKSFFDVIERRNALNKLANDSNFITGASGLIGDYIAKETATEIPEGYTDIGSYFVKPTTLSGAFSIGGVATAYNLWSKFFPYDAAVTQKAFSEVLSIIGNDNLSDAKTVEFKQDIFRGMKKYFAASKFSGIISQKDDINEERARLFIDSDKNTSIAKYLKTITTLFSSDPAVSTFIKTNKLINRFEYEINKNGEPSLIKFNNAAGEEFDEQYLYESLATLMEVRGKDGRITLPTVGNKTYTLDTLAQDLIAYSYLGNAIQEAIQFTKYTPVSYLNQVGFSQKMRQANLWLRDNPNILGAKIAATDKEKHLVSEYTMQYVQHNPERVRYKLDADNFAANTIKIDDNNFHLKTEERPSFISVYDSSIPKGEKKFRLYWFDGEKYTRVPVLGTFGMDEYQPRNSIGTSLVNGRNRLSINPQAQIGTGDNGTNTGLFSIETGDTAKILKSLGDSATAYSALTKALTPYVDSELVFKLADIKPRGIYDKHSTITIKKSIINDSDRLADTIVHELVHYLTYNQVNKYITVDDKTGEVDVEDKAPSYVANLVRIYNNIRKTLDQGKLKEVTDQARLDGALSPEDRNHFYGFTSIHEFMTMALTNKEFQEQLAKIPYRNTGMSVLDKFKEFVKQVLEALGVKFDENFTAAHAISNIFGIIQTENERNDFDPYQAQYDDSINEDFDSFTDMEDQLSSIDFKEEPTTGYRTRTIKNASADATIAIAVDFNSAGEKLTKSSVEAQNKKYIPIHVAGNLAPTQDRINAIVEALNEVNAKTLNIAGNGIYTMKGKYTQDQVDNFTYELLKAVVNSPNLKNKITSVRTGGQTGFDEAGAKAAARLGLPTMILAPKGWAYRNIEGRDIYDEKSFKARFDNNRTNITSPDVFPSKSLNIVNQKCI